MGFNSLKEKCEYYRSLNDTSLDKDSYIIVMLDGRSFSKGVKKKMKLPFDEDFINMMNKTAEYLCANIQGCKFAYVQSDEISLVLTNFENEKSDSFFGYRNCKMLSLIPSMATGKFNQLMMEYTFNKKFESYQEITIEEVIENINDNKLYEFDCKCWNVDNYNDAIAWFLYRQIDCVRNSKQQAAQSYLSHKELMSKDTDEQVNLLKDKEGIDWNTAYTDGMKYGRFIYKEKEHYISEKYGEYERSVWKTHDAFPLTEEENREKLKNLNIIPIKD